MIETLVNSIFEIGYIGFFFYMVIVGTFIPLPTQLLLLPAGYLVSLGKLDFTLVTTITAAGTTTGAFINYTFAKKIIANFFEKKKEHLFHSIEDFFKRYGKVAVLLAPLIPSMGQYISLPAGLSRMPLIWFIPITYVSNLSWNILMLGIGYVFGADSTAQADKIIAYLALAFIVLLIVYISMRYIIHRDKMKKLNRANS
ncbi:MAG: VTT domain-containing protein [Campylobacterales bacterium]|nr:VTT domain-containing protein [Campylobacterales bacterium]